MTEVIGMFMIFSAIVIGLTFLLGWDFSLKEKILAIVLFEVILLLLIFGCYLMEVG